MNISINKEDKISNVLTIGNLIVIRLEDGVRLEVYRHQLEEILQRANDHDEWVNSFTTNK